MTSPSDYQNNILKLELGEHKEGKVVSDLSRML